jgi:hypothetical protein
MRTILHFLILSLSLISVKDFKVQASNSKPTIMEDKDEEGFFKMFREKPQDFTADKLKVFLRRAEGIFPQVVTYTNNGHTFTNTIYRRYFTCEGYYFTFLTRHNLIDEAFFNLENVRLKFKATSSSGVQTKLHYNLYLGDNEAPFSFRILYVSELKRAVASTPLIHTYQKSKTNALARKVVHPLSGDWNEALKRQVQIELQRTRRAEQKSKETKTVIEQHYLSSSAAVKPLDLTEEAPASSSVRPIEENHSMLRKFSSHRLPVSAAKSPPKKVVLNTSPQARAEIEQHYSPKGDAPLQRKGSRVVKDEKRQHEKDFQDKKDKEERTDSTGRRASISRSEISSGPTSPRISPDRGEQSQGPKSEPLILSLRSNTNQKLVPLGEKEALETSSDSPEETEYSEVSQADIEELFEHTSGSE